MRRFTLSACLAAGLLATPVAAQGPIQVDPELPVYQRVSGVSGNLNSIGSDTLNNLMTLWAEGFRRVYPNVRIQIEGKGSSTAPPALIEGTAQLGPMSRDMSPSEIDRFEKRFGFRPSKVGTALDSLAVYVHKDNPVAALSIPQVDAIFSRTRSCGGTTDLRTWGQVGLGGTWGNLPFSLYGRNSASGTYGYFKEIALCKGDFRNEVKEQPGSASVVNGVANDRAGIGYSGVGYRTSGVRAVALSREDGGEAYEATYENVLSGRYPLARQLVVYYVRTPGQPMDTLTREFLRFVLSREGQEIVAKDGYMPLPERLAARMRKDLD